MPELPEVEAVRRLLERRAAGRSVRRVEVCAPKVLRDIDPDAFRAALVGARLGEFGRRGKYLIARAGDHDLVVHLGMTGRVRVEPEGEAPGKHYCLGLSLDDGRAVRFYDTWRWGEWRLLPAGRAEAGLPALRGMGPEPLGSDFTAEYLAERIRKRNTPIKAFLLDQTNIAGLGNIYADESLHRARIHPERRTGSLTNEEITALHGAIRAVMCDAVEQAREAALRKENLDNYDDVYTPRVYGRAGEACPTCGAALLKIKLHGRGATLCPDCQH